MKYLAVVRLKISDLTLDPDDMQERMRQPHVRELAASIGTIGLIAYPVVEGGSYRVRSGLDRVAAHMVRGDKEIDVRVANGTPEEFEELEIVENLLRRQDDQTELRRRLVELRARRREDDVRQRAELRCEGNETEDGDLIDERPAPGRPRTPKGEARAEVAQELGLSESTLRADESRARAAEREKETPPAPPPPPIRLFEVSPKDRLHTVTDAAAKVQAEIDEAALAVKNALRIVNRLGRADGISRDNFQALASGLQDAGFLLRSSRPASVCPWCKLLPPWPSCDPCGGRGYVGQGFYENAPKTLLEDGKHAVVFRDGREVKASQASDTGAEVEDADLVF